MSTRTQQLFKSEQRKLDKIIETRLRLARYERERRMGMKAANVMLEAVARNVSKPDYKAWENGK
jgi:hypothetical protein